MSSKLSQHRRAFLTDVGRGMLIAGVGLGTALDLGLAPARAGLDGLDDEGRLSFGPLDSMVAMMEETPAAHLGDRLIEAWRSGTSLKDLVAAAAYANARRFGGEDYVGFHTIMAMSPAFHMAHEIEGTGQILPVVKVLNRNTRRIQEANAGTSAAGRDVLKPIQSLCCDVEGADAPDALRTAVRAKDTSRAEELFSALAEVGPAQAFNSVLEVVMDNTEVHRVVLPYRAWDLLSLIGLQNAHTLLRQSLRYCLKSERNDHRSEEFDRPRTLLPRLIDEHHLAGRARGTRSADATWIDALSKTIFEGSPDSAAGAAAAALAEGFEPDAVGQAITLAANQLILRDAGRPAAQTSPGKPVGSVHGDSIGVHACDSANAWRNMARIANDGNAVAALILGAFQVAYDRINRGGDFLAWSAKPDDAQLAEIRSTDPAPLLAELEAAIRANDQGRAMAAIHQYGETGHPEKPAFAVLRKFAISEDGALHAEKFYRTVSEEFSTTHPDARWRHLTALARVTASEFGQPAPGVSDACERLGVSGA